MLCSARACFGLAEDLTLRLCTAQRRVGLAWPLACTRGAMARRMARNRLSLADVWQLAACKTLASKQSCGTPSCRPPTAQKSPSGEQARPLPLVGALLSLTQRGPLQEPKTRSPHQVAAHGPGRTRPAPRRRREAASSREPPQSAEAAYEQQHAEPSVVAGAGRTERRTNGRRRRHRRHDGRGRAAPE